MLLQFEDRNSTYQRTPILISSLSGKGIRQISAGVHHCAASTTALPVKGVSNIIVPSTVPTQYSDLKDVPCDAIYARLMLLNYFSKLISDSWVIFSTKKVSREIAIFSR